MILGFLFFMTILMSVAQAADVLTTCSFYTCDEWTALGKGFATGSVAIMAHLLDWNKKSVEQRKHLSILWNGLFWAFLGGGVSGGLAPSVTDYFHIQIGGFVIWLQMIIAAGLGVSAGSIAAQVKSGLIARTKSIIEGGGDQEKQS
jgi:hypothetical protein